MFAIILLFNMLTAEIYCPQHVSYILKVISSHKKQNKKKCIKLRIVQRFYEPLNIYYPTDLREKNHKEAK